MTKWPLQKDCDKFYGNPRGANGGGSAKWESANLTLVKCPFVLRYDGKPVKGLRVHKKCAESLARALNAIWVRFGRSQTEIDRVGMSIYGGGYNYRLMRGGNSLSMHSWGCAIDIDPARNGLGDKTPAMDRRVIEEFEREGWEWGGHWSRTDGMHFQAAWTRANPPRLKATAALAPVGLMSVPEDAEPDAAEAIEPEPVAPAAPVGHDVKGDPEIFSVQRRLKALNYSPGMADGLWGSNTCGAVNGFINDRELTIAAPTSLEMFGAIVDELKQELSRAESESPPWKRPVSPARASADPKVVAEIAPEIAPAKQSYFALKWAAFTTFVGSLVDAVSGHVMKAWNFFTDHKDDIPTDSSTLGTFWEYVSKVPTTVWLLLAAGAMAALAFNIRRGVRKSETAVKTGARQ